MKEMKNIHHGSVPSWTAIFVDKTMHTIETESQPWSTNSPRGEALFVRLACFPSTASRDWYTNKPTAFKTNAHHGAWRKNEFYVKNRECKSLYIPYHTCFLFLVVAVFETPCSIVCFMYTHICTKHKVLTKFLINNQLLILLCSRLDYIGGYR